MAAGITATRPEEQCFYYQAMGLGLNAVQVMYVKKKGRSVE